MGLIFLDKCAGCGVTDDKEPLIKVSGCIYELGTSRFSNVYLCAECFVKVKRGQSKNFYLKG